jgi:hypothetical protein
LFGMFWMIVTAMPRLPVRAWAAGR